MPLANQIDLRHAATLILLTPWLLASSCSPGANQKPKKESGQTPVRHSTSVRPEPLSALPISKGRQMVHPDGLELLENPEALDPFFDKLARLEKGEADLKVRAIHYGDSHIASDMLTGVLRRRYQARFGDAGHGFILPGKPWRTYHHMDVDHGTSSRKDWDVERIRVRDTGTDGLLGLGGVTVRSAKRGASVWVGTEQDGPVGQKVSSFEIFYLKQPGGGAARLSIDGRSVGQLDTRSRRVEAGFHRLATTDGAHKMEIVVKGSGEVRLFGTALERQGSGFVYDTVGINGARYSMPTYWDRGIFQAHLNHRSPDLIVTTYGSNEVGDNLNFEKYTRKVVGVMRDFKAALPGSSCLIMGPPDQALVFEGDQTRLEVMKEAVDRAANDPNDPDIWDTPQKLIDIIAALRRAARESGCAFWNTYRAIGGAGTLDTWARSKPRLAHKDRVHMTAKGYEKVADMLYKATMYAYEQHLASAEGAEEAPGVEIPSPPKVRTLDR